MLLSLNNLKYFNLIFLLFLVLFNFSYSKMTSNPPNDCESVENEKEVEEKINSTLKLSKDNDVYYFLFFASMDSIINIDRKDNFPHLKQFARKVNTFFSDFMTFSYLCKDVTNENANIHYDSAERNKFDEQKIYVIQKGEIKETKTVKYFSEDYMDFLVNKMNLSKLVESKLIQSRII
jgi:hypothetical protein